MRTALRRHLLVNQALHESSNTFRSAFPLNPSGNYDVVTPVAHRTLSSKDTPTDTHSSPSRQHWLDRRFPGLREWLEAKNRRWWLKGLQAWYRKYPALQGSEQQLQSLTEQTWQQLYAKHKSRLSDERSETHLQVACLVLATYKTLLPYIKNHEELTDIVRAHMGEQISPALRFLLRSTLYLSPNPYKTMANRLKGLQQDYGKGFDTDFTDAAGQSSLQIKSCFYHDVFAAEGVPQLALCCCCSQDRIW
ncbi:hypothetical protein ABBQ32_004639 [Trebouxia sp. C0010 RCD-2024]